MLSIIVPVYNTEKYLRKCITSILDQTFTDYEVIVVDDGSSDGSKKILKEFEGKDSKIKCFYKENGGLSSARNYGLDHACGSHIMFVDSDDYLLPGALESLMKNFSDDVSAVFSRPVVEYEDLHTWKKFDDEYFAIPYSGKFTVDTTMLKKLPVVAWAKVYRKSIIDEFQLRFPEGLLYEDNYWYWCFFSVITSKVFFVQNPTYCYVRHKGSIMADSSNKKEGYAISRVFILRNIIEFYVKQGIFQQNIPLIRRLAEEYFWASYESCAQYERSLIVWELTKLLRDYGLSDDLSENDILKKLSEGKYYIDFYYAQDRNKEGSRHTQIKKLITPYFPEGSMRREFLKKLYKIYLSF